MSALPPVSFTLDRPRALAWTHTADFRLGGLERVPTVGDLGHKNLRRSFWALTCFVWAGLTERDALTATPEAVAELLGEAPAQLAAMGALYQALVNAGVLTPEKKTEGSAPSTAAGSANGPAASSNLVPFAPATATAPPPNGRP